MAVPNVLGVISRLMLENVDRSVTNFHVGGDRILDFFDTIPAQARLGRPDDPAGGNKHPFTAEHIMVFNAGGTVTALQMNLTTRDDAGAAAWNVGLGSTLAFAPDPIEAPQPTIRRIVIGLKETVGVITVEKDQVMADDFGLTIGQFVAQLITDVTKKLNNWRAANLYTDGTGWLAQIGGTPAEINATGDTTVVLTNGTNRRFEIGERYDIGSDANWPVNDPASIGDTSAAKLNTDADVVCVGKDPSDNTKIKLRGLTGLTAFTPLVGDHLVKKGAVTFATTHVSHVPDGFDFLIGNTGEIHGLDRTQFEILQSQVDATGSLTSLKTPRPELITDFLDNIQDAGYEPPAFLVSSRSVRSKYAYIQGGQGTFVLPNMIRVADGGFGSVQTSYEDRVYSWALSSFSEGHTIYGVEPRAFTKFMPGTPIVNWWNRDGGVQGVDNIFRFVDAGTGGRQRSKLFAAEWSSHWQVGVIQPFLNFVIRNVKGQRD